MTWFVTSSLWVQRVERRRGATVGLTGVTYQKKKTPSCWARRSGVSQWSHGLLWCTKTLSEETLCHAQKDGRLGCISHAGLDFIKEKRSRFICDHLHYTNAAIYQIKTLGGRELKTTPTVFHSFVGLRVSKGSLTGNDLGRCLLKTMEVGSGRFPSRCWWEHHLAVSWRRITTPPIFS